MTFTRRETFEKFEIVQIITIVKLIGQYVTYPPLENTQTIRDPNVFLFGHALNEIGEMPLCIDNRFSADITSVESECAVVSVNQERGKLRR